jgi:hypothetical protein
MLYMRGGIGYLPQISRHFQQVVLLDSDPFIKAMNRQQAILSDTGQLHWASAHTEKGMPVDRILETNIRVRRDLVMRTAH